MHTCGWAFYYQLSLDSLDSEFGKKTILGCYNRSLSDKTKCYDFGVRVPERGLQPGHMSASNPYGRDDKVIF